MVVYAILSPKDLASVLYLLMLGQNVAILIVGLSHKRELSLIQGFRGRKLGPTLEIEAYFGAAYLDLSSL
jgi:hypothetical protein